VRYRLYLPEVWANDPERGKKSGVPENIRLRTKPEIALGQIRSLLDEDVAPGVVLADAAYGNDHGFRAELERLEFQYAVGIQFFDFGLAAGHRSASASDPEHNGTPC
jgi:SRSO17 transposase